MSVDLAAGKLEAGTAVWAYEQDPAGLVADEGVGADVPARQGVLPLVGVQLRLGRGDVDQVEGLLADRGEGVSVPPGVVVVVGRQEELTDLSGSIGPSSDHTKKPTTRRMRSPVNWPTS